MPSKTIQTSEGPMIVDENFDESSIDATSMLPKEPKNESRAGIASPDEEDDDPTGLDTHDTVIVNNKTFTGKILQYTVTVDKITKQKTIKVMIRQDYPNY